MQNMPKSQLIKNLQRFRLVTFDITDTLLRFKQPPAKQYAITAKDFGITNIDETRLNKCFRQQFKLWDSEHPNYGCHTPNMSWEQWWIELVKKVFCCVDDKIPLEKLNNLAAELIRVYRTSECWSIIEHATDALQTMRDADKCIGVISNFDPSLKKILEEMQLHDKFDFVLTSYEAGVSKPSPQIFEKTLQQLELQPHEALHIGNRYDMDYVGAQKAGWSSLLITTDCLADAAVKSDHVYANIQDMLNALKQKDIRW